MINRNTGILLSSLLLFLGGMFSCTPVNDTVGGSLVPDDMQMKIRLDTVYGLDAAGERVAGIKAYLVQTDSFPSTNETYVYLGSTRSDKFGVFRAGAAFQYLWVDSDEDYSLVENEQYFGYWPVVDSLVFNLVFDGYIGDTSTVRTFELYELTERFFQDSTYYSDRDMHASVNPSPIATFSQKGLNNIKVALTGSVADRLMSQLIDTTGQVYRNDSLFINKFPGFYIKPAEGSPDNTSVTTIDLASSGMTLYVRNYTEDVMPKDTFNIWYTFESKNTFSSSILTQVNLYEHDYAGTLIENHINDTMPESTPLTISYVEGTGGVCTYLRFDKNFVRELKSKVTDPYTRIIINRAELKIPVNDAVPEYLAKAPNRLGAYALYCPYFIGISDYTYYLEYSDYGGITLPYGGYLNWNIDSYQLNLATLMQAILDRELGKPDEEARDYTFTVAPAVEIVNGIVQTELRTGPTAQHPEPLGIILTYTLLR